MAVTRGPQDQYTAHRVGGGGSFDGLMKNLEGQKMSRTSTGSGDCQVCLISVHWAGSSPSVTGLIKIHRCFMLLKPMSGAIRVEWSG